MRCGNDELWTAEENAKNAFPSSCPQLLENPPGFPQFHTACYDLYGGEKKGGEITAELAYPIGKGRRSNSWSPP
jgi:hypothetical protein